MTNLLPPCVALLVLGTVAAQEPPVSGPAAGVPLTKVQVYAPSGPRAGHEFDAAADLATGPGALLFAHEISRNVGPMIGELDRLAAEYECMGLHALTVVVINDRTAAEAQLQRSSTAMNMRQHMVLSLDGADGPGNYALNRKCSLTLVLTKDGKVHKSVAFTDTGRQDFPRLRQLVEEVTGPLPKDEAELRQRIAATLPADPEALRRRAVELTLELLRLRRERAQDGGGRMAPNAEGRARRPMAERGAPGDAPASRPQPPREGKAPEDADLRTLLRAAINPSAGKADLDSVFAAIDKRVGDDAGLRTQAVEMCKLVVSLGYGTDDARARASEYVKRQGGAAK